MSITFIDVLEELEKTSGTNDKIDILQRNKNVSYLAEYLDYATNPQITFGIAELPEYHKRRDVEDLYTDNGSFEKLKDILDLLANRSLTGNKAKDGIISVLANVSTKQEKWLRKCLLKDLASVGLGLRLLEKGFGEVKKFRLMLAAPEEELEKVADEEGALDKKANGVRTVVLVENGRVVAIYGGRNGLIAESFYFLVEEIEKLVKELGAFAQSIAIDGEVHINDCLEDTMSLYGFKYRSKEEFIGAKGKLKEKAWADYQADEERIDKFKADAKFTIFDVMPLKNWEAQSYNKTLKDRKEDLKLVGAAIERHGITKIEIIPSIWVKNQEEAISVAQDWIARGFEGGVYKIGSGIYEWKRSRNWVKIKEVVDFEIQFTGYEIQKDKYNPDGTLKPAMVGKVKGVDKDGLEYKVGTGKALDEKTRTDMLNNWAKYNNMIGTCSAQRPSGKDKYICPRLDIIRLDRNSLD